MKLLEFDKRAARKLCGIPEADSCPVVLMSGSAPPRLVRIPSHYVDQDGEWIYTPGIVYGTHLPGYRYVPEYRLIEVSHGWLDRLGERPMKLTIKEWRHCCSAAMVDHAPPYDVLLIPGNSPPRWETCAPYSVDMGTETPIQTEIRILVGREYIQSMRDRPQTGDIRYV